MTDDDGNWIAEDGVSPDQVGNTLFIVSGSLDYEASGGMVHAILANHAAGSTTILQQFYVPVTVTDVDEPLYKGLYDSKRR